MWRRRLPWLPDMTYCVYRIVARRHFCEERNKWDSKTVRKTFVDFFCEKKNHLYVPSSSVIPKKGEGTYFTNAGMNQFKPLFLGTVDPQSVMSNYKRVSNYQKCVRVGGKHNDLDDVGMDLYHHTFFEMLGSWSFGDYFKREACSLALELLTTVYNIPLNRLYFTYFSGDNNLKPDLETKEIWLSLGIPQERLLGFGMSDNFWDMGYTGPCGPCTEIHYDHTGEGTGAHLVNQGSPDVVELWNLVFMQYDRSSDGSLKVLPQQHVDTGMGLERLTAVLQGTVSNYDTDLFKPIFTAISQESKAPVYSGQIENRVDVAYRVVADHLRMSSISIGDGLLPGGTDLEYRLRNVMSRCLHWAYEDLSLSVGSLSNLVDAVVETLGDAHPSLLENHARIKEVTLNTELWYADNRRKGQKIFEKYLKRKPAQQTEIPVGDLVKMNSSVPFDILESFAKTHGLTVNTEEFDQHIQLRQKHTDQKKDTVEFTIDMVKQLQENGVPATDDSLKYSYSSTNGNYEFFGDVTAKILCLVSDGFVRSMINGEKYGILLDKTVFYSEGGGQAADVGFIKTQTGTFRVTDVQEYRGYVVHYGTLEEGEVSVGEEVSLHIDEENRLGCMRNHTATHLLNSALRRIISSDVVQSGSSVTKERLTFDFTSLKSLDNGAIQKVEDLICSTIYQGLPVISEPMSYSDALNIDGILYLRDHEYPGQVNVVSLDSNSDQQGLSSAELCGGTHVHNTKDIEDFCVVSVSGTGESKKQFKCLTGQAASQALLTGEKLMEAFTKVKSDLKLKGYSAELAELVTDIHRTLTTMEVPRRVRDEVQSAVNDSSLKVELKKGENALIKTRLVQKINTAINSDEDVAIVQAELGTTRMAEKAIKAVDCSQKPVVMVSQNDSFNAILTVSSQVHVEEVRVLLHQLSTSLRDLHPDLDFKWKQKRMDKKELFSLVCAHGSKDADSDIFKQTCYTFHEHFKCSKKNKN